MVRAASRPRRGTQLLVLEVPSAVARIHAIGDLPGLLRPGDLVVLNDAATLPASFPGVFEGAPVELRLAGLRDDRTFDAVLFGAGSFRHRTEDRPAPPIVAAGPVIRLDGGLEARVGSVSQLSPRLVAVDFGLPEERLWPALYAAGRPIQYSYHVVAVALAAVQTLAAGRPWSFEPPSAALPLTSTLLAGLRARGVRVATVAHAAGLSATGDPAIDAALPFPERFELPEATVRAIQETRASGGRVVAIGTTVVRALEGSGLRSGTGVTDLKLGASSRLAVVDAVLTGVHERGVSHYELLRAFAPDRLLEKGAALAEEAGFLAHEFGDSCLVLAA
ncbi:MAG: S-adenosylmethionine:tRNA ribosyltransferase-isomerase [Acidobacteria bacterium]|nr:S-adenosylmethionine:tRNA ribosyltransferase-isomerase [Acidobacteriota bacterium]